MESNMDSLLTSVDVLVEDENKIVTYKTLCAEFAISAIQSKRCLENYASGKEDLTKTYVVSGRNDKGICVTITRDIQLEALKSKLTKVFAVSIYSVQKCIVKDSSMLFAADSNISQSLLPYSCIKYEGAHKLESQPHAPNQGEDVASIIAKKKEDPSPKLNNKNTFFKPTKKEPASEKQKVSTEAQKPRDVKVEKAVPKPSSKSNTKKGGMDMFVSKTKTDPFTASKKSKTSKISIEKKKSPVKVKQDKEEPREEDNFALDDDLDNFSSIQPTKDKKEKSPVKETNPIKETKKKPTQHKRKSNSTKPKTKRRRIQISSSESDSEEEMASDISPPPAVEVVEQEEEPTKIDPQHKEQINSTKGRTKKKVLKTKTYMDEEGDMVTEKHFEYESFSDDEEDFKIKPSKKKDSNTEKENKGVKKSVNSAKSNKITKTTKQSTLQGFFIG